MLILPPATQSISFQAPLKLWPILRYRLYKCYCYCFSNYFGKFSDYFILSLCLRNRPRNSMPYLDLSKNSDCRIRSQPQVFKRSFLDTNTSVCRDWLFISDYYTDTCECLVTLLTRPLINFNFQDFKTELDILFCIILAEHFVFFESTCHKPLIPSGR